MAVYVSMNGVVELGGLLSTIMLVALAKKPLLITACAELMGS